MKLESKKNRSFAKWLLFGVAVFFTSKIWVMRCPGKTDFGFARNAGIWYTTLAEPFNRAGSFMRVPLNRVVWLANGAKGVLAITWGAYMRKRYNIKFLYYV